MESDECKCTQMQMQMLAFHFAFPTLKVPCHPLP